QGLAELDAAPPGPLVELARADFVNTQAIIEFDAANFDESERLNDRYLEIARQLGDHELELDSEFFGAQLELMPGEDERASDRPVAIAQEARDRGYESVGVTSFRVAAMMAARVMDYPFAAAAIHEGLEYADAIEQSHCRQQMATISALMAWAHGDWDVAIS